MKEKPTDHIRTDHEIDSENEDKDWQDWPETKEEKDTVARNLENGKKMKWYDVIDLRKMIPLLPVLRRIRGSKKNITIPIFSELNDSMQSVFEHNKTFFRFRTQVDLLAYYLGARILEQIYFTHKGLPVSKLSKLLEAREESYRVRDDMKTVKELFQKDVEAFQNLLISPEILQANFNDYLAIFDTPEDKKRIKEVMEGMLDGSELDKARDRARKRVEYNRLKLKVVGNE